MQVKIHKAMTLYILAVCFYYAIAYFVSPWAALALIAVEILARIIVDAIIMQRTLNKFDC